MSQKTSWVAIGIVVIILLAAGVVYWQIQKTGEEDLAGEQQTLENLQQAVEQAAPVIEVPRVNPLGEAIPDVNPLEKVNPFRTKNPFE